MEYRQEKGKDAVGEFERKSKGFKLNMMRLAMTSFRSKLQQGRAEVLNLFESSENSGGIQDRHPVLRTMRHAMNAMICPFDGF